MKARSGAPSPHAIREGHQETRRRCGALDTPRGCGPAVFVTPGCPYCPGHPARARTRHAPACRSSTLMKARSGAPSPHAIREGHQETRRRCGALDTPRGCGPAVFVTPGCPYCLGHPARVRPRHAPACRSSTLMKARSGAPSPYAIREGPQGTRRRCSALDTPRGCGPAAGRGDADRCKHGHPTRVRPRHAPACRSSTSPR
ncbi:MAG: hypothetical protein KatS3mg058_0138 [Roseiflexus sp.]|nr:MAG: hypothetical protein KatS3mg058_0138 [Roseiflexus sp.]